jgi:hypothetical protein
VYGGSYGNVRDRRSAKTQGLWEQRAAYGDGGVQNDRAFTRALKVREANTGTWRQHETKRQLAGTVERRKMRREGKGHE